MSFPILERLRNIVGIRQARPQQSLPWIKEHRRVVPVATTTRSILGSGNFDELANVRFTPNVGFQSRMRNPVGPRTPVKTYAGFGGRNPTFTRVETGIQTPGARNFGNLPPKVDGKLLPRSAAPIKTF